MPVTIEDVWNRIAACAGQTFRQMRGKEFTYALVANHIVLDATNQNLTRSEIAKALPYLPLKSTAAIQHLRAPSYIYALLTDPRIIDGHLATPLPALTDKTDRNALVPTNGISPSHFEISARRAMEKHYGHTLNPGILGGVPKRFDFVSSDGSIVGDAKFYTLVGGVSLPPAKYATIAEYIWLLEKTKATHKFLIFGNDIRVPEGWVKKYGHLPDGVDFFFLHGDGRLEKLHAQS